MFLGRPYYKNQSPIKPEKVEWLEANLDPQDYILIPSENRGTLAFAEQLIYRLEFLHIEHAVQFQLVFND